MHSIPVLETERLILRGWYSDDFDAYAEMVAHPEVGRFLPTGVQTRADAWRQMAMVVGHWSLRDYGTWAVERKSDHALVGRIGFWFPEGWPEIELIWTLARPYWEQGYATEGSRAAMDFGFESLDLAKVVSHIDKSNLRSQAVARRLGQALKGPTRITSGGKHFEVGSWEISRGDWTKNCSRA